MNRLYKSILLCFVMIGLTLGPVYDTTNSGAPLISDKYFWSNTTISGGYSESTTTYQSGSSSNTQVRLILHKQQFKYKRPTKHSVSTSMSAMSQDVCVMGVSGGLQYPGIGLSMGVILETRIAKELN